MAAPINLSSKFISIEQIQGLIQLYQPIVQQADALFNQPGDVSARIQPPSALSLADTVLQSSTPTNDDALAWLQKLLILLSNSLTSINLSGSNVTGRVFFRAKERHIASGEEAAKHRVFLESRDARNKTIVRDDIGGSDLYDYDDEKRRYYYVSTRFNDMNNEFIRMYTQMDWLNLLDVNVSSSDLSSYGLSALICSTSRTLTSLKMNDCPSLDAAGFTTLVSLCRKLRVLEFNNCKELSEHAVMHLAELPIAQVAQLELISCKQPHLSNDFCMAFLHALEDKHFQGVFVFDSQNSKSLRGNIGNPSINSTLPPFTVSPSFISPLRNQLSRNPASVIDLVYADITRETLQILTREQRDFFTNCKTELLSRMSPKQQQSYASIYGQRWPFTPSSANLDPVYSLDLSQRYINSTCLESILRQYGSHLYVLKLSHTFISSAGLSALSYAPNVRVLSLSSCHGLVDKTEANRAMMSVCKSMPELMELSISDSRLSGRMMSSHPFLALFTYYAHGCPISSAALRLLSESCCLSLSALSLSRCAFINNQCMYYITRMQRLVRLDISYCGGLRADDVRSLAQNWPVAHCERLRIVDVTGIQGVTAEMCIEYGQRLTIKKSEALTTRNGFSTSLMNEEAVEMVCNSPAGTSSSANLSLSSITSFVVNSHPYELVKPQFSSAMWQQKINDQVRRATQNQQAAQRNEPSASHMSAEQPGSRYSALSADDMSDHNPYVEPESAPLMPHHHVVLPNKATSAPPLDLQSPGLQDTNYSYVPDYHVMPHIDVEEGHLDTSFHHPPPLHIQHSHSSSLQIMRNTSLPSRPSAPSPYPDVHSRILSRPQTLPHNFHNSNDASHSPFSSTTVNTPSHHSMSSNQHHHSLPNTPANERMSFEQDMTTTNPPRYVAIEEMHCENGETSAGEFTSAAVASYAPLPDQRMSE